MTKQSSQAGTSFSLRAKQSRVATAALPSLNTIALACAATLSLMAPALVAAQAVSPTAEPTASQALPEVKVTADAAVDGTTEGTGSYGTRATDAGTRMPLTLRQTPQSVSVIGRQQIEDQNLTTLNDVLLLTPGIVGNRIDERVTYSSRGFDLGMMIDGVPTLSFNSAAAEDGMVNMAIYDRVEVIRGSTGLLNGVGSPGGSINLVRKRPTADFNARAGVGVGSWNRYQLDTDISGSLNAAGSLRGRVVASHADGDTFVDRRSRREDVLYGILELDLAPGTVASAGLEYQKTAIDGASFCTNPPFYANGSPLKLARSYNCSTSWTNWDMTTQRVFVNLSHAMSKGWKVKADLAYAKNKREMNSGSLWSYPSNISLNNQGSFAIVASPSEGTNKSLDVYATGPFDLFGRTHKATIGFNINKYDSTSPGYVAAGSSFFGRFVTADIFNPDAIPRPDFSNRYALLGNEIEEKGIYASTQLKATDALSFVLGGRLSWYENDDWYQLWYPPFTGAKVSTVAKESSVFTPYAGVVYDINKEYSVYASYTDIFIPNTNKDLQQKVLDPKRGKGKEIGLKGEHFGGKLNTSLAFFRTEEDNVALSVGPRPDSLGGGTYYRTVDGARSKGFEFTAAGELLTGWQLMGGYTYYVKRDNKNQDLLPEYPRRTLRVSTTYRLPGAFNKLTIGGNANFQSRISRKESYGLGLMEQGGTTLIDLLAKYEISPKMSASLNIDNVTDKHYYTGLAFVGYQYGAPRNAWLRLNYKF